MDRRLPRDVRPTAATAMSIAVVAATTLAATLASTFASQASPERAGALSISTSVGRNSTPYAVTVAPDSSEAWALVANYDPNGTGSGDVVLRRRKGGWSRVKAPGIGSKQTYLDAIAAGSAQQIWLSGSTPLPGGGAPLYRESLAVSTGGAFRSIAVKGMHDGRLTALAASSATNAWLIGENGDYAKDQSWHWNGRRWKPIPLVSPAIGAISTATVSTSGPRNAWLLGINDSGAAVVEHWNGAKWKVIDVATSNQQLKSIATSGAHTWLVGRTATYDSASSSQVYAPLVLTRIGSAWKRVALPVTGSVFLQSVTAQGNTAYVVGERESDAQTNETQAPVALSLHGRKATADVFHRYGKVTSPTAVAASSESVLAVGFTETGPYCSSPFHALAATLKPGSPHHAPAWKRLTIPAALVPADKTGVGDCP